MSKQLSIFLISLMFVGFFVYPVSAEQAFTADILNKDIIVGLSNITATNLTIKNNQNVSLVLKVSIEGEYPKNIILENRFIVGANSTLIKPITFNPKEAIGRFQIRIFLEDENNKNLNFSIPVNIWVQHPDKYIIKDFTSSIQNGKSFSTLTLIPHDKLKPQLSFDILDANEKIVKSTELSQVIEKEEIIQNSIDVSDLATGKYKLRVFIKGTNLSKTSPFEIGLSRNIRQERKIVPNLLYDEVKISLYNYGNLVENDYKVYEEIGKNKFVTLLTNSSDIIKSGDNIKYEFTIEKIRPGEVATIIYRLENWQNLLTTLVIIAIVIILLVFMLLIKTKPRIKKSFMRAEKGRFSVILEIKNRGLSEMKDTIVRDFVQPIAKITASDTGGLTPSVKSSQIGTELLWKMGNIKRGESRILPYSIDTLLNVESLKLSSATVSYTTGRKNKGSIKSNEITVQ